MWAAPGDKPRRNCRFLLVDDDAQNLDALREALVPLGHHVDTALSGVEALEKLQSGRLYDVVLCDLAMPGMNGWEVARRALEIAPDLEFYIATGWGGQFEAETPRDPPVSGVLSKPINLAEVEQIAAKVRARDKRSTAARGAS